MSGEEEEEKISHTAMKKKDSILVHFISITFHLIRNVAAAGAGAAATAAVVR